MTITVETDEQIRNKVERHVTSFRHVDGTGFPVNPNNKKCIEFFLKHRCHGRHKFHKIDKKVNDNIQVTLELPDGTEFVGMGKYIDIAKHDAVQECSKFGLFFTTVRLFNHLNIFSYSISKVK